MMKKYNDLLFDMEMKTYLAKQSAKDRSSRLLAKKLNNLYNSNTIVSRVETNATYRSYEAITNLLYEFYENETNASIKNFFVLLIIQMEQNCYLDYVADQHETKSCKENIKILIEKYNQDSNTTKLF